MKFLAADRKSEIIIMDKVVKAIFAACLISSASAQQEILENHETLDSPLIIDASAIWNTGIINANGFTGGIFFGNGQGNANFFFSAAAPWTTLNTLNITNDNSGIINLGSTIFDYTTETAHFPSESFINRGEIYGSGTVFEIKSDHIQNSNYIQQSPSGRLLIESDKLDLKRGAIRIGQTPPDPDNPPLAFPPFQNHQEGTFNNAGGVTMGPWGAGTAQNYLGSTAAPRPLDLTLLTTVPLVVSPPHEIFNGTTTNDNVVFLPEATPYVLTTDGPNETIIQMVFVQTNFANTNLVVDVRFTPNDQGNVVNNAAQTAVIRWANTGFDKILGREVTQYVYLEDSLATLTNVVLYTNSFQTNILKPSNYRIYMGGIPLFWDGAQEANTEYADVDLKIPDPSTVTNLYTGYSAGITGNASGGVSALGGSSDFYVTNSAGRLEIDTRSLEMDFTRIIADGAVSIRADEFDGGRNSVIDSPLLSIRAGLSEGTLALNGLIPMTVTRFSGQLDCYSASWQIIEVVTNDDPLIPGVTNNFLYHALIVDGQFAGGGEIPVNTANLELTAENISVNEDATVTENFIMDGVEFVNEGNLRLSAFNSDNTYEAVVGLDVASGVGDITDEQFPRLKRFVNNGGFNLQDDLLVGWDLDKPIDSFLNYGSLSASSIRVKANDMFIGGSFDSFNNPLLLETSSLFVEEGELASGGNLKISADSAQFVFSVIDVGGNGTLVFDVAEELSDDGVLSLNSWSVTDGFKIVGQRPASGDLTGTSIISFAENYELKEHVWAGDDRGASEAGFVDNLALQTLSLSGGIFSTWRFAGLGDGDALYVDFLDLGDLTIEELEWSLEFADNFRLYFHETGPLAAADLDGMFDGHLVWVPLPDDPAPGDGDGMLTASISGSESSTLNVGWNAAAGASFRIEYCSDIANPEWIYLDTVVNDSSSSKAMSYSSELEGSDSIRFYRAVLIQ